MFKVTKQWMEKYKSPTGGWLAVQLKQLDEHYPLQTGWFQRCLTKVITEQQKLIFEAGAVSKSHARKVAKGYRKLEQNKNKKKRSDLVSWESNGWKVTKVNSNSKTYVLPKKPTTPKNDVFGTDFLQTYEWRKLRMQALKKYGPKCMCCGATPQSGAIMNVDHIKPRKIFPELALDINNLQILCHDCNHGKGNWDMTDWRVVNDVKEN